MGTAHRPSDRSELLTVAALGLVGACLVVATGGRLARQAFATPPTNWFGLLDAVNLDQPSLLPATLIGGITLTLLAWSRACVLAAHQRMSARQAGGLLAVWATPVTVGPPILSLDVYSYAAHGMMLSEGLDPYRYVPAALPLSTPQFSAVDPLWRYVQAPYGPLAEAVFRVAHSLAGGNLIVVVLLLRLLTLGSVALIAAAVTMLAPPSRRAEAIVLAVVNPIVLFQLLGAIHLEALMMALLMVGLVAVRREQPVVGLILLSAAAAVKWPALLAVAAVVVRRALPEPDPSTVRKPVRVYARRLPTVARDVTTVAAASLGFAVVIPDGFGWIHALDTPAAVTTRYSPTTIAGDLIYRFEVWRGGTPSPDSLASATRIAGTIAAAVVIGLLLATIRGRPLAVTVGWALLALALLGPVLHPWYLTWGLIPLSIAPSPARYRVVLTVTTAGVFLALQHCSLLFVGNPWALRWLRAHSTIVAVVGYAAAATLVWALNRRLTRGQGASASMTSPR